MSDETLLHFLFVVVAPLALLLIVIGLFTDTSQQRVRWIEGVGYVSTRPHRAVAEHERSRGPEVDPIDEQWRLRDEEQDRCKAQRFRAQMGLYARPYAVLGSVLEALSKSWEKQWPWRRGGTGVASSETLNAAQLQWLEDQWRHLLQGRTT